MNGLAIELHFDFEEEPADVVLLLMVAWPKYGDCRIVRAFRLLIKVWREALEAKWMRRDEASDRSNQV
jgi:hypothetical protein